MSRLLRNDQDWRVAGIIVVVIVVVLTWAEYGADIAAHIISFGMFGMIVAVVYLFGVNAYKKRRRKKPHEEETQRIAER